jgi:CBS domain-containing protein
VANAPEHAIPTSTSLLAALQTLNELDVNYAPVTRVGDEHTEVVGVIYRSDVLSALYELVREARSEEYGVT